MPNWCECELKITGDSGVLACLEAIKGTSDGEETVFDFNAVIPMPPCLKNTTFGTEADYGLMILGCANEQRYCKVLSYSWVVEAGITTKEMLIEYLRQQFPNAEDFGRRAIAALKETGHANWYYWCIEHWGTKWNASGGVVEAATERSARVDFCTAWAPPAPVVVALSAKFPHLTFTLRYWEGGCAFKGVLKVRAGTVLIDKCGEYRGSRGG